MAADRAERGSTHGDASHAAGKIVQQAPPRGPPEAAAYAGRVAIRAVLFDVGGPLDLEVTHERLMDAAIQAALGVDEATYAEANAWAVESFASNAYQAIIWRL